MEVGGGCPPGIMPYAICGAYYTVCVCVGGGPISSASSLLSNLFTLPSACADLSSNYTMLSDNDDPSSSIALYAPLVPYPFCPIVVPPFAASIFSYSAMK